MCDKAEPKKDYDPIPDHIELSPEAQKMFDELDATFDDDSLIDQIKVK